MTALRRGVARYQTGTKDVPTPAPVVQAPQYPASGLKPDLSNAVMSNGFLVAPGDPNATIAARQQGYVAKAQQDPAWAQQWGVNPQTGVSNDERYLAAKVAAADMAGTQSAPPSVLNDFTQTQGAPGGALQADRQWLTAHPNPVMASSLQPPIIPGGLFNPMAQIMDLVTRGTDMAALQRGVPRYADGSDDVSLMSAPTGVVAKQGAAPPPPVMSPVPMLSGAVPKQGVPTEAAPAGPVVLAAPQPQSGGFGQLMSGLIRPPTTATHEQFSGAQQNPESSPVTSFLAGVADHLNLVHRADSLATGPSIGERLIHMFAGRQGDTSIDQRTAAAQTFKDPLVHQYLVGNPDQLAAAEQNPQAYAQQALDPGFRQTMQKAVGLHADTLASSKIAPHEQAPVVSAAMNSDSTVDQAHAAMAPHKYTDEEFIKIVTGMPMKTVALLFGPMLQHILSPQQQATQDYIKEIRQPLIELSAKYNAETDPKKKQDLYDRYSAAHQLYLKQLSQMAKGSQLLPYTGQEEP